MESGLLVFAMCMGLLALELTESEYFLFDGELVYVSLLQIYVMGIDFV